ncbi:MAG: hypothetical protein HQL27_09545 [Candidatus Omnitrophica bacterium]|nr:hypothetical protein [Candidatus Omnitrophota bacterium]
MSVLLSRYIRKENISIFAIIAILILLLSGISSALIVSRTNSLKNNGNWVSSKSFLEKKVSTTIAFMRTRPALARGRLNLGSWNGYNEIYYHKPLWPKEISFRFLPKEDSYIVVLFNKEGSSFEGILLGSYYLYKNVYFKADASGGFTEKKILSPFHLEPNKWRRVNIVSRGGNLIVYVNGNELYRINADFRHGYVGFRGGQHNVYIDDVSVKERSGNGFKEDFGRSVFFRGAFIFIATVVSVINIVFLWIFFNSQRQASFAIVFILILLVIVLAIYHIYDYFYAAQRYPKMEGKLKQIEEAWVLNEEKRIKDLLKTEEVLNKPLGQYRILFLGSSQTWGAGALKDEDVFPARIERELNTPDDKLKYRCINAGISGLVAKSIYELYEKDFIKIMPDLAIINLSNNDNPYVDNEFVYYLEKFCLLNREKRIKTIFILEPNSLEHRFYLPLHDPMKAVAEKYGIPVLDLNKFLADNHEEGFQWWDSVHMSSFGHKLSAKYLTQEIRSFIGNK